jgi:multidrug efflux pump subunit AcrB
MWIVRLALRRPFTFLVMSVLTAVPGTAAVLIMPTDIFPYINIPVVSVMWSYPGVLPDETEKRIVTFSERAMTTFVNDIEHIESQLYKGVAVIRVFFQPSAKVELAVSQVTTIVQTILRVLPPGIFPPKILRYDASSVPILQIGLSSSQLGKVVRPWPELCPNTAGHNSGRITSTPYGGKTRQIMVDLNPSALYAKQRSATNVSNALSLQNLGNANTERLHPTPTGEKPSRHPSSTKKSRGPGF